MLFVVTGYTSVYTVMVPDSGPSLHAPLLSPNAESDIIIAVSDEALWSYPCHSLIDAGLVDDGYEEEPVFMVAYVPFSALSKEMVAVLDRPNSVFISDILIVPLLGKAI
jgi:hypothetical protein